MKKFILVVLVFVGSLFAKENYVLDSENSNVYFKSKADMLLFMDDEVIGVNQALNGGLVIDKDAVNGKIYIDSSAFDSDNETRDSHITEILNYQTFKNIVITINEEVQLEKKIVLNGTLFINGVTQKVLIPVRKIQKDELLVYMGKLVVKYSDFNLKTPTVAGGLIKKAKDEIEIGARVSFVRSK